MMSYLSLSIDTLDSKVLDFTITNAHITESFENLFMCVCEGYIESLEEHLIGLHTQGDLHPKNLINKSATFNIANPYTQNRVSMDSLEQKVYKGIISNIKYLGINPQSVQNILDSTLKGSLNYKHFFNFTLRSPLFMLGLNSANRMYSDLDCVEIIKATLMPYYSKLNKKVDFSNIYHTYEKLELVTQYKESDLEFLTRIAHNYGIYFYEDDATIYFCDHYKKSEIKVISYNANINNALNVPCINALFKQEDMYANSFTKTGVDVNYPEQIKSLEMDTNKEFKANTHIYESASSFSANLDLKTSIALNVKRIAFLKESILAKSNVYHLSLGDLVQIDLQKKEEAQNTQYFITQLEQTLRDEAILANTINPKENLALKDVAFSTTYHNTLSLIPSFIEYAPESKPKPKAPTHTQGIIVGANKESPKNTIYTDEYGRVKVKIHCFANQNIIDSQNNLPCLYVSSPFLRVASFMASSHSGAFYIPRVGDEVIIAFFDEDIDKPYVSGSLYNKANCTPQYNYPRYKREIATAVFSQLSSVPMMFDRGLEPLRLQEKSENALNYQNDHYLTLANATIGEENIKAEKRNEITLKNDRDNEEIYILAQKNYKEEIGNAFEQTIKGNKISEVGGLFTEFIALGQMQNIAGFKNVNVGAAYLENTLLAKNTYVGLDNTLNVGVNQQVHIGQDCEKYIGNNQKIRIKNNKEEEIQNDAIQRVGHNKNQMIQGTFVTQSNQSIKTHAKENIHIEANGNFHAQADRVISFKANTDCSFSADCINVLANKESVMVAQKKIASQVGDTLITQSKNAVVIQVGGVQVVIDSKGLRVKGGDIRID